MRETPHDRYPGPPPFEDTPEDHSVFFGRPEEVRDLTQEIIASRLLVLFGKSGLGKTSLMQAGVFPELRAAGLFPIALRLSASKTPLQLIADSAKKASLECRDFKVDYVAGEPGSAWVFFKTAMFWREDSLLTPVLVFDQFEEIFTLIAPEWRRAFTAEIGPLVSGSPPAALRQRPKGSAGASLSDAPPRVKVVVSLKEEYLGSLQEFASEIPGLFRDRFRLLPLSEEQGRQAIVGPAGKDGTFATPPFRYQKETLKSMLDYLKGRSGGIEPFQLQLLCQHAEQNLVKPLVKRRDGAGLTSPIEITPQMLGDRSAMEAVMRGFYNGALQQLPWRERRRAKVLCDTGLLLSTGNRTSLQEDQIRHDYRVAEETLKYLVEKRILREEPRLEGRSFEISHDTLAQAILQTRPWRLPAKYKFATGVLIAAIALLGQISQRLNQARAIAEAQTRSANDARKSADDARNQAVTERKRANEARGKAEGLVGFLIGEDLLGKIRPMGRLEVLNDVQREVNKYLESLKGVPEGSYSDVALQNQGLASLNQGDLYCQTYELKHAVIEYEKARHAFGTLLQRDNKRREWRHYLADATAKLASVESDQFHLTKALGLCRNALGIRQSLNAERSPHEDRFLRDEADSHVKIGDILESQGHLKEASKEYEEAVRLAKKASRDTTEWLYVLQDGLTGEGAVLGRQGRMTEAEATFKEARDYALRASKKSPFEPEARYRVGVANNKLANLKTYENPEQVLPEYQKLHTDIEEVASWDPKNKQRQRDLAATLVLVGEGYEYRGGADSALQSYGEALKIFKTLEPLDDSNKSLADDFVWLYRDWGDALLARAEVTDKDRTAALGRYDEALKIMLELVKIDSSNTDVTNEYVYLRAREARTLIELGEYDKALESTRQGLKLVEPQTFLDPTDAQYWEMVRELREEMASTLLAKKDYAGALEADRDALHAEEKAVTLQSGNAAYHSALALVNRQMGDHLRDQGKLAQATDAYTQSEQALRDAIALKDDAGSWNSLFLLFYDHVAPLRKKQGDQTGTLNAYHTALESEEKAVTVEPQNAVYHSNLGLARQQIGDQLGDQGELAEAMGAYMQSEQALREAIGLKDDAGNWNRLFLLFYSHVAPLREKQGDQTGTLNAYRTALESEEKAVALNSKDADYNSNLSLAHQIIGDQLQEQGELVGATGAYTQSEQALRDAIALKDDAGNWNSLFLLFYDHVAPLRKKQGDQSGRLIAYRAALESEEKAITLEPNNAVYHHNLALAHQGMGDQLRDQGKLAEATGAYTQSEQALRGAIGLEANATYWNDLFLLFQDHVGPMRVKQGDAAGGLDAYRQGLKAIEQALTIKPKEADYWESASLAHWKIGRALQDQDHSAQALEAYEEAEQALRRATELGKGNDRYFQDLYYCLHDYAAPLQQELGDDASASRSLHEALTAAQKAAALQPNNDAYHYEAYLAQREGGDALQEQGELVQAITAYSSAEGELRQAIKLKNSEATYWNELCVLLYRSALVRESQGERALALESYSEAREAINKAMELDPKEEQYRKNRSDVEARLKRLKAD